MKRIAIILLVLVMSGFAVRANAMEFGHPETYDENCILGYFYFPELSFKSDSDVMPDIKVEQNQGYWQYSWFSNERAELFTRVGAFEFRVKDAFTFTDEIKDFKAGINYYGTVGVKALLFKMGDSTGFGAFAMLTLYENCEEQMKGKLLGTDDNGAEAEILTPTYVKFTNIWAAKYGVTFQTKLYGVIVYGGAFAAKSKMEGAAGPGLFNLTAEATANYTEKNSTGAFIGAKIPLDENLFVSLETEKKDKLAFGLSINIKFD